MRNLQSSAGVNFLFDESLSQKEFLTLCKKALVQAKGKLTWDEMAAMAEIEPRALKSYRLPTGSAELRRMPKSVRAIVVKLVLDTIGPNQSSKEPEPMVQTRSNVYSGTVPALSSLVIRQAQQVMLQGSASMVSGIDKRWGMGFGLSPEDHKAMALVSRSRLSMAMSDIGSEIHDLLSYCRQPLGEWLPIPEVVQAGLSSVRLIDNEEILPSIEAQELAQNFSGLNGFFEEQIFATFTEILTKQPVALSENFYTLVREFVVRNPIVSQHRFNAFCEELPSALTLCLQNRFYEPLEQRDSQCRTINVCEHCGNVIKQFNGHYLCTTSACASQRTVKLKEIPAAGLLRLTKGLRQYWMEPGIDEIILFDALKNFGLPARLYPYRDRVDIDLGEGSNIGIDLKSYVSPELLSARLNRNPGGIMHYQRRWLVIPDWLVRRTAGYIERVKEGLGSHQIEVYTVSDAFKELTRA